MQRAGVERREPPRHRAEAHVHSINSGSGSELWTWDCFCSRTRSRGTPARDAVWVDLMLHTREHGIRP